MRLDWIGDSVTIAEDRTVDGVLTALTDPARLQSLEDSGLLTGGDASMDRLARLASALVGAPRAFVSLVTDERQHLAGMVRHDDPADTVRQEPLSASLCQFAVATEEPLIIPNSHEDPLVRNMERVRTGEVGAYAGVPLRTSEGHVLGTLCVIDGQPRTWEKDCLGLLEDLTALATQEVEQRLTLARERRLHQLVQDLAQHVPPLADAVHSLVDLADQEEEPRLQRYAALTRSRLEPVLSLAGQAQPAFGEPAPAPPARARVDLRTVVERCVRSARAATGTAAIRLEVDGAPLLVRCDGLGLERSLTHVVVTALHHSQGDTPVVLRLGRSAAAGAHVPPDTRSEPVGTLTVLAEDSRVPTGELARIVSRFHGATCDESVPGQSGAPASIRITGGTVVAASGAVRGEVSRDGRLALHAQWLLEPKADAVSSR